MKDVHRIRLRGPWKFALLRHEPPASGRQPKRTSGELPIRGVTTVPADWSTTVLGGDFCGQVRYRRGFARPTGLEPHETVWLVVDAIVAVGQVRLNGVLLGTVEEDQTPARFEITALLQDRNQLMIDVSRSRLDLAEHPERPAGLTGEVRLEIHGVEYG